MIGTDFSGHSADVMAYMIYNVNRRNTTMDLKEKIAVMQHFEQGGEIEVNNIQDPSPYWVRCYCPCWQWDKCVYRIKPKEPRSFWLVEWTTPTPPKPTPTQPKPIRVRVCHNLDQAWETLNRCEKRHTLCPAYRIYRIVELREVLP